MEVILSENACRQHIGEVEEMCSSILRRCIERQLGVGTRRGATPMSAAGESAVARSRGGAIPPQRECGHRAEALDTLAAQACAWWQQQEQQLLGRAHLEKEELLAKSAVLVEQRAAWDAIISNRARSFHALSAMRILVDVERRERKKLTVGYYVYRSLLAEEGLLGLWETHAEDLMVQHTHDIRELLMNSLHQFAATGSDAAEEEREVFFYGLVVTDGRIRRRRGRVIREPYHQVKVVQALPPAFPYVRARDIILSVDGRPITTLTAARREFSRLRPTVELLILREQQTFTVTVCAGHNWYDDLTRHL